MMDRAVSLPEAFGGLYCPEKIVTAGFDGLLHGVGLRNPRGDAGQKLGELGDSPVNGGWAPHLHFQVMLDLLGHSGDFPGVCRKSEADLWLTLCPDPRPLLGLPPRS